MNQQAILITGATSGIGLSAVFQLLARGHRVFVTGRSEAALADVKQKAVVQGFGERCETLILDVDDATSAKRAHDEVLLRTGGKGIDVLVNNAGYATAGPMIELSDEALRAQFETNVFGLMRVTKLFADDMLRRGKGRILMIGSVSGRIPAPMLGAYHASKYALEALNDALRMELRPFGVDVVMIEPGTIRTEFAGRAVSEAKTQRAQATRYRDVYAKQAELVAKFDGVSTSPDVVAKAIVKQVETKRPRTRVVAPGGFMFLIAAVKLLPTRFVDALMMGAAGLTKRLASRQGSAALCVP